MLRIRVPSAPLSSKIVPALPPCSSVPITMSCFPSPFKSPGLTMAMPKSPPTVTFGLSIFWTS